MEGGTPAPVGSEQVGPPQPDSQEQAQRLRSNTPWRLQRLRTSVWPGVRGRGRIQSLWGGGRSPCGAPLHEPLQQGGAHFIRSSLFPGTSSQYMWPPKALSYAWGQGREVLTQSLVTSLSEFGGCTLHPQRERRDAFSNSYQGLLWTSDAHLNLNHFPTFLFFGVLSPHLPTCASLGCSGTTSPSALFLEPLHQLLQDL